MLNLNLNLHLFLTFDKKMIKNLGEITKTKNKNFFIS